MSFLFRYLRFHDIIGGIHVPVDDGVDKLNRKYTLLVFLFLALPIFTKQYIGDPIECFAPVYFAEHQSRYINSYCWTQSTYYMVPVGDPDDDGDQQEPPDRIMPDEVDYFIGFETVTHVGNEKVRRVRVSYYQWAPLILLAQGLCFYIPFLIWNSCANNAGVKLRRLLKKASDIASLPPGCQQREALLAEFVDQFHTLVTGEAGWCADLQCGGGGGGPGGGMLGGGGGGGGAGSSGNSSASSASSAQANGQTGGGRGGGGQAGGRGGSSGANADAEGGGGHHRRGGGAGDRDGQQTGGCCLVGIPIVGSLLACCLKPCTSLGLVVGPSKYLCLLYLAVKFAYVFNVALQFFLLGKFLGRGYLRHGLELINRLLINGEWWASPRFPLSTLCQVRADMSGGLRTYTCQCVLPINVFNEKIFSVVWFYMAFLMPLNVLSLLFWMYRTLETNRMSYIRLCLWRTRLVELNQIHRTVRRLSQSYLGYDGVFLLRLIEHNHGSIMATLIMSRLWEFYANQIKLQEDANQMALANNAQHTLSNTTTALSNQYHQFLTNQPFSGGGGGGGGNNGGGGATGGQHHPPTLHGQQHQQPGHAHGPGAPQGAGHHHHPPPPQPLSHAQQHHAHHHHSHGGGGGGHSHGPGGHSHPPPPGPNLPHFVGGVGGHPPLQPTQVGPPGPHPGPPPQLGAHGHHSGQISQAPGHHPLHAANTAAAAAHHVHHVAQLAAAAAAAQGTSSGGPHLSGAFTGATHNLLAQLQQQQQHANHANNTNSNAQTNNSNNNINQQPPGNVAAAVAALAAAAAATSTSNSQPGSASNQSSQQQQQVTTSANQTSGSGAGAASGPIHLQAMKQQQQQQQSKVGLASATGSGQTTMSVNAQGQQQPTGTAGKATTTSSATTSFINANTSSASNGAGPISSSAAGGSGPPLPPPPPAHVVAAVAAGVVPAVARGPTTVTTPTQSSRQTAAPLAATTRLLAMTGGGQQTTQRQQPK